MDLKRFFSFLVLGIFSCMLSGRAIAALPQGFIDQVVLQNNIWTIKGWACQPYLGSAIKVQAYLNNIAVGVPINTNQPAEVAIHTACGTNITSGIKYRFEIALNSISSLSGQSIKVNAVGPGGTVALNRSNQFGLPSNSQTPDKVLAAANRILLMIAHQDDEILFSPFLGRYCGSKTCKIVSN